MACLKEVSTVVSNLLIIVESRQDVIVLTPSLFRQILLRLRGVSLGPAAGLETG